MQCDVCQQKEATVFLTQIVGGKMQKVNLCESCSKEKGVDDPTGFALTDLLLGMGGAQDIERPATGMTCTVCGFTQADFKKTGRLGCSACYDIFAEGLETMLKNMHKGSEHVGKAPAGFVKSSRLDARIKTLQSSLERAVADEEYEKAADLRDQIRKIETSQEA
ncbi:MAG TPA: UvrB/UvrC motif-containing protein [Terrimicrobiaceae bacterium]|nr:UvrB/UvrC motif-containing protein [Terrimicrobiaceae bacterium]